MLAFTNTEVTKPQLIASLEAHAAADRIVAGQYWNGRGGCAVGCSIHDFRPGRESRYEDYEPLFGIPRVVARLEDLIFERLPQPQQREWPLRFSNAVRVGAELSGVWDRFALWLLVDPVDGVAKFAKRESTRKAIETVGSLYARRCNGDNPSRKEWQDATAAAYAAAAYYADAYYADAYYAYAAAAYYADAYYADAYYADADAAYYATYYAAYAGQKAKYDVAIRRADKLIELIQAE